MDLFERFEAWYQQEKASTDVRIPSACCLSTTGTDGYPNARFVALKEVTDGQFIVAGPMDSRKGNELNYKPRAALTFWWPATEKQVRIQGDVKPASSSDADRFFDGRERESQILAHVSSQGRPMENAETLKDEFQRISELYKNKTIPRPENWGAIRISPVRIEFLDFKTTRFHERVLYTKTGSGWIKQQLQP